MFLSIFAKIFAPDLTWYESLAVSPAPAPWYSVHMYSVHSVRVYMCTELVIAHLVRVPGGESRPRAVVRPLQLDHGAHTRAVHHRVQGHRAETVRHIKLSFELFSKGLPLPYL